MAKYVYNVRVESNDYDSIEEVLEAAGYDAELLETYEGDEDDGIERGLKNIKDKQKDSTESQIQDLIDNIPQGLLPADNEPMPSLVEKIQTFKCYAFDRLIKQARDGELTIEWTHAVLAATCMLINKYYEKIEELERANDEQ